MQTLHHIFRLLFAFSVVAYTIYFIAKQERRYRQYKADTVFYSQEWKPYITFTNINVRQ